MKKIWTKGDIILIVGIVLWSIFSLFSLKNSVEGSASRYVSVKVAGEEIQRIELTRENIGKTFPVNTRYGYNLIEIGDGKVRVIEADCPEQIDVLQGYIENTGEIIVCLPHRLIIEIVDESENHEDIIDGVNY